MAGSSPVAAPPGSNRPISFTTAGSGRSAAVQHPTGVNPPSLVSPSAASNNQAGATTRIQAPPHGITPLTSPATAHPQSYGQATGRTSFQQTPNEDLPMDMDSNDAPSNDRRMDTQIRAPNGQVGPFAGPSHASSTPSQSAAQPKFGVPSMGPPPRLNAESLQSLGSTPSARQKVDMWDPEFSAKMALAKTEVDTVMRGTSLPPPNSEAPGMEEWTVMDTNDEMGSIGAPTTEATPDYTGPNQVSHIDGLDAITNTLSNLGLNEDDQDENRIMINKVPLRLTLELRVRKSRPTTGRLLSKASGWVTKPPKRVANRQILRGESGEEAASSPPAPCEPAQAPLLSEDLREEPAATEHLPGPDSQTSRESHPGRQAYVSEESEEEAVLSPPAPCEPAQRTATFEEEVPSKAEVSAPAVTKPAPSAGEPTDSEVVEEVLVSEKSSQSDGLPKPVFDINLAERYLSDVAEVLEKLAHSVPLQAEDATIPVPVPTEEVSDVAPSEPVRKESDLAESSQTEEVLSVPGSYPATLEESVLPWLREALPADESASADSKPTPTGEVKGEVKSAIEEEKEQPTLKVWPPHSGPADPWDFDPVNLARVERKRRGLPSRLNQLLDRHPTNPAAYADFCVSDEQGSESAPCLPSSFSEEHSRAGEVKGKEAISAQVFEEIAAEQRSSLEGSMEAQPTGFGQRSGSSPPPSPSSPAFDQYDLLSMEASVKELEESVESTYLDQDGAEKLRSSLDGSMKTWPSGSGRRPGLSSPTSPAVNALTGPRVRCMGPEDLLEERVETAHSTQNAAKRPRSSPEGSMEAVPTGSGHRPGLSPPTGPVVNAATVSEMPGTESKVLGWLDVGLRVMVMTYLALVILLQTFVLLGGHLETFASVFHGPDHVLSELRAGHDNQNSLMDWLVYVVLRWLAGDRMTPG